MCVCVCVYLADSVGVAVQLICEHESLCEHRFVIVRILDDGRGSGVPEHLSHVTFKPVNHCCHQLFVPVEEVNT